MTASVRLPMLAITLACISSVGISDDQPAPPGAAPELWLASATQQADKVVVQIASKEVVVPRKAVQPEPMKWKNLRKVVLGETVKAYSVDGQAMENAALLKKLAKPRGVLVFVQYYSQDLNNPDPFYLKMLREDTVVLVVEGSFLYPPPVP